MCSACMLRRRMKAKVTTSKEQEISTNESSSWVFLWRRYWPTRIFFRSIISNYSSLSTIIFNKLSIKYNLGSTDTMILSKCSRVKHEYRTNTLARVLDLSLSLSTTSLRSVTGDWQPLLPLSLALFIWVNPKTITFFFSLGSDWLVDVLVLVFICVFVSLFLFIYKLI